MKMPNSFQEAITKAATVTVNVGKFDAQVRTFAGLGMIFLSYKELVPGWAAFIGVIVMITAALRYCPAYSMLEQSTAPSDTPKS
jgi:hypothetical protein